MCIRDSQRSTPLHGPRRHPCRCPRQSRQYREGLRENLRRCPLRVQVCPRVKFRCSFLAALFPLATRLVLLRLLPGYWLRLGFGLQGGIFDDGLTVFKVAVLLGLEGRCAWRWITANHIELPVSY